MPKNFDLNKLSPFIVQLRMDNRELIEQFLGTVHMPFRYDEDGYVTIRTPSGDLLPCYGSYLLHLNGTISIIPEEAFPYDT